MAGSTTQKRGNFMSVDAQELHREMLVFDAHRDVAYEAPLAERFLANWLTGVDLCLALLKEGGIDAQVFAFCIAPSAAGLPPTAEALRQLDLVMGMLESHGNELLLARTAGDIRRAKEEGKIAVILSLEGAEPICNELGLLRMFYRMGFRATGLTWNFRNTWADGRYEGPEGRLSTLGAAAVREMNRLGMVVDLAHLAQPAMRQVLQVTEQPVIHSHGVTLGACPTRAANIPDDILEAIARSDGVFCVTTVPEAVSTDPAQATLERFLDHIDHAVKVMGSDHVGLGADFDVYQIHLGMPRERWLRGLEEADRWPAVTAGLLARGYSPGDVRQVMGENLLRVLGRVIG
jgi:membrane dipeptidase